VSYTGVRGLMMLTQDTAAILDVSDREDAEQSIHGGARWFAQLRRRLPRQIVEPDRTAMALAAYNQGLGHLLDARQLAAQRGGDANRWSDVRSALPLLAQPEWAAKTRYGQARGDEAVDFVDRVLRYHEALRAIDGAAAAKPQVVASR
jgi:membrane-bound lytic murein transglycosylase F